MNKKLIIVIIIFGASAILGYGLAEATSTERCVPGRQLACDGNWNAGYKVCDDNGYWSECILFEKGK